MGRVFGLIGVASLWREDYIIERVKKTDGALHRNVSLSQKEEKIVEILRSLDYGEIHIVVKRGTPVHVKEIKKSIEL